VGLEAPGPEAYRQSPADIKLDVCVGRAIVTPDKRWSIAIYSEAQCGADVEDGEDLCAACAEKEASFGADKKFRKWHGRITEDPYGWQHMLGTAWAQQAMESGKLFWNPAGAAVGGAGTGDSGSVTSNTSSTVSAAAAKKAALKAEKEAKKAEERAAKAAEKEAEKAAKAALKEAAKAAAKAEKEAEKAAKAALKKAAKAAPKVTATDKE
jgi:hypothetical protein